MADVKPARAELQNVFSLTDRFQSRLATVGDTLGPVDVWATLGSMPVGDIEALAFLVMMQAAKSARDDLKTIMEDVRAIDEARAKQRRLLDERQGPAAPARREAELDLDSMVLLLGALLAHQIESDARELLAGADAGELQVLRMQAMIDRLSKAISAISNMLEKLAETQSTIVQNLK